MSEETLQELYCHHCGNYLVFPIKKEKSGNFLIPCTCGIDHKRVVTNGIVTGDRWGSNNDIGEKLKAKARRRGAHVDVMRGYCSYEQSLRNTWDRF